MASRPMLYLVDGHSLAYRHHFAYINNPLTTSDGEPTSAIFGFSRSLLDILGKNKPDYLAVTFDDGLSGRDVLYSEYKGTRDQMPDDLTQQMPRIYELVQTFNIPILMVNGYEADDLIGTAVAQAEEQDVDICVVSGDGDILQLLSPKTKVQLRVRRKEANGKFVVRDIVYDEDMFRQEYGLEPRQLIDLKALKGDTSDNIPGVAGIGDKGATQLLQTYGSLDGIYEHIDDIKGATQRKLIDGRESAYLSRNLATIRRDMPITLDLSMCVAHDYDREKVEALFRRYEFRSLVDQLNKQHPAAVTASGQLSLFGNNDPGESAPPDEPLVDFEIVDDEAKLDALVQRLKASSGISFDLETTSTDEMQADMVGVALAVEGERGYYIPVGHEAGSQLPLEVVLNAIRGPLTDPNIPKFAHNAKYDLVVLQRYGVDVTPIAFDTMLAQWVIDPDSTIGLKGLVEKRFHKRMTEIKELIGSGKKQITMHQVAIDLAAPYAAADAAFTHQLVAALEPEIKQDSAYDIFKSVEMPLVPVLAAMEQAGVLIDIPYLAQLSVRLTASMQVIETQIHALADGPFNINSPKQLNDILFGRLGLSAEGLKKTSHGFSTAANVLDTMRGDHPIIDKILEYREISKLKGTYVDAFPTLINPATGRLHTNFNQAGAATGRLSSNSPNLQNIPIRTEAGREVRKAFITPGGMALLAVDYSQVELRIMAHMTQEPTLIEAFQQGQDIHAATAAVIYGKPLEEVTKFDRNFAKRINFGILYGMGAFRLARESDLTLAEARVFIDTYFGRLPNVLKYIEDTKEKARTQGYVETLFGRKRYFPQLSRAGAGRNEVQQAEREAINMPVQGTAADIIKKAMITLYGELAARKLNARMLLQVHDELVFEVPEAELHETAALVVECMEGVLEMAAPLRANAQYGQNWLEMQSVGV